MNSSDLPSRIVKAFAVNGDKNTIAIDSTTTTLNDGTATFDSGFPPVTMQPISAGGLPPKGQDMNGLLYSVTLQQQWYNAGMTYPYNSDFSTTISGYPRGAMVPRTDFTGQWLNLNEGNRNSPESPIGANTGWVPLNNYGVTQISGLNNSSVTMSSLQAAKDRIILSGTLTANINIIFPAWIKSWSVYNNCTGNFNVTCRTATGSGFIARNGIASRLFCDGVNINDETPYSTNNPPSTASLNVNGWEKDQSTGIITQWGTVTNVNFVDRKQDVLFPIEFPTAVVYVRPTILGSIDVTDDTASIECFSKSKKLFVAYNIGDRDPSSYMWMAKGY